MYDAAQQRVKKVSITLECTPGSNKTQCEAMEGACHAEERPCSRRSHWALQKADYAFPADSCTSEAAALPSSFAQVLLRRPAHATAALMQSSGWLPPPTRINMYRSLSACKPGALDQSGCVS